MLSADSLKQRARERLLDKLASGSLQPGTRVSESQLAKELGTSRGPVREAVSELTSQGILDQIPGFGAYVKEPSPREMEDLYEFREAIESHGAFLAAGRIKPHQLEQLRETLIETREMLARMTDDKRLLSEAEAARWIDIDARFHGLILQSSGSVWLQRHGTDSHFLRRIWCHWLDPSLFDVRDVLTKSFQDHKRIVQALSEADGEAARRWMLSHIQATKDRYVLQLSRRPTTPRPWITPSPEATPPTARPRPRRKRRRA